MSSRCKQPQQNRQQEITICEAGSFEATVLGGAVAKKEKHDRTF